MSSPPSPARDQARRARPTSTAATRRRVSQAAGAEVVAGAFAAALGACGGAAPAGRRQPAVGRPAGGVHRRRLVVAPAPRALRPRLRYLARRLGQGLGRQEPGRGERRSHPGGADGGEGRRRGGRPATGTTSSGSSRAATSNVYHKHLVDVTDLAKPLGDALRRLGPAAQQWGTVQGAWKGVPDYFLDFPANYRKDLFDRARPQAGRHVGRPAQGRQRPEGEGATRSASRSTSEQRRQQLLDPLLWCYGASYVAEDGKTVTINSPRDEARRSGTPSSCTATR